MNPTDRRLQLDLAATRYLDAIERQDFAALTALWQQAARDADLEAVLRDVHAGLLEEQAAEAAAAAAAALTAAVAAHLPSAEVVRAQAGPLTVADVADELFRHTPDRLPPEAHLLNERLRASREPVPADLALSKLTAWGEALFGPAAADYWKAFRQAAVKLELLRAAEAEFQLAARRAPRPEG